MTGIRIVGFSGNTRRPSRTRTLVETIAKQVASRRRTQVELYDLVDAGPDVGAFTRPTLPSSAAAIVRAIETADALIVGTPVYKGSYTGLFKHLIDFVDPHALAGTPILLAATGGGTRHTLVVEHHLRPLFGFFGALSMPTSVYADDSDFEDGIIANSALLDRIDAASAELASFASILQRRHAIDQVA